MATVYKKNGDYDLSTKKGKEFKGQSDAAKAWVFRRIILPLLLLALLVAILEYYFPGTEDKIDRFLHLK